MEVFLDQRVTELPEIYRVKLIKYVQIASHLHPFIILRFIDKEKSFNNKKGGENRFLWAKEHRVWSQWNLTIWTDEARFEVCVGNGLIRAMRTKAEVYHTDYLKKS